MKITSIAFLVVLFATMGCSMQQNDEVRQRISINDGWTFFKYEHESMADNLIYDVRPDTDENLDEREADAEPTEAEILERSQKTLKPWILPTGNAFINDPAKRHVRPEGNPGSDFPFVQKDFDDSAWEQVRLPHDWAAKGPFLQGHSADISGSMGRLPAPGVAWYRKKLEIPASDEGKSIYLDIDGAMSYAMVWLNGNLVGGWPYGYNSFRLNLTPFLNYGGENQIAIRLDNPNHSSRWYPGAGLYRNVWLTKTNPVQVGQWGTYITTPHVSEIQATVNLEVSIENHLDKASDVEVITEIFNLDADGNPTGAVVASFQPKKAQLAAGSNVKVDGSVVIENPRLWGPYPSQTPNQYVAVTTLKTEGKVVDKYDTRFGIRALRFDPETGVHVNGEPIYIKGVNQHHDLGALGAAFNVRAAERQLEILREAGCNAIRMAHNPPAPELLELTDRMGFLVFNEIFDVWERRKAPLDFHLIFPDWYEQDVRAFVRRDRNSPSTISWSYGNEVGEQYTGEAGVEVSRRLNRIVKEEDTTRPTTVSKNFAKPPMAFPEVPDMINLNYQGEGIRNAPEYAHLQGINTEPLYPSFCEAYPDKIILSSENAAALSIRGEYIFPVTPAQSSPISDGVGGDPEKMYVSSYELYTANFGSSADKVFATKDKHPYVNGGFVWSGWDYLGEPTPYYSARSTYFGIIDLAGFKKDRFYLYQSRWRPELPMVHILPHWNWPERVGKLTPVHVFTSGDEAELFLNGKSLGRKAKGEYEYRLRWDDVVYEPGELKVVAYKNGEKWAEQLMKTTGAPAILEAAPDRDEITADGYDLSFVSIKITDKEGLTVLNAKNHIRFSIEGPGEIVATDNGDPTNFTPFPSHEREAFNGYCLVIVRGVPGKTGNITVKAEAEGLKTATASIQTVN